MSVTDLVLAEVSNERRRQDAKWGEQNHSAEKWLVILQEEVGEAAKAVLERDGSGYLDEMKQVAAVAIAAQESYLRHGAEGKP